MRPFTRLGNETLVLNLRVPLTDSEGNEVRDPYNKIQYETVPVSIPGCSFRLISSTEHDLDVHATDVVARGMLPPVYLVDADTDTPRWVPTPVPPEETAVTWLGDGQNYVVQGPGRPIPDAAGDRQHIEFVSRLRSG